MAPVVQDLVASMPAGEGESLWWAFALGADLGGNTTAVAAGANVVIIGIAARNGTPVSFWQFTRYGIVVTAMTLVVAWTLRLAALLRPRLSPCLGEIGVRDSGLDQPGPDRVARQLRPVPHPELGQDVGPVTLDRLEADRERLRDLVRRVPLGDELDDLVLARGEPALADALPAPHPLK